MRLERLANDEREAAIVRRHRCRLAQQATALVREQVQAMTSPSATKTASDRQSAIRCDFLTLMFKKKLTGFVATLSARKQLALKQALGHAMQLHP